MLNTIVIRRVHFFELHDHLYRKRDVESMAIAFFKISATVERNKLLIRHIISPTAHDYLTQTPGLVSLRPEFMEKCFQLSESSRTHLLDIHTHPWSNQVSFSSIDDCEAIKTKIPYVTRYLPKTQVAFLVFGKYPRNASARIWSKLEGKFIPIQNIFIL